MFFSRRNKRFETDVPDYETEFSLEDNGILEDGKNIIEAGAGT